jgi:hypothetical protein
MNKYLCILMLCAGSASVSAVAASSSLLLAPSANDQVPPALGEIAPVASQARAAAASALDHQPAQISWALESSKILDAAPTPFVQQSREFWTDVSQTELRGGIKFTTSSAGALIRLSPQGGNAGGLDPAGILIRRNGSTLSANVASSTVADTRALRSAGMEVTDGSLAFRLAPSGGSGEVEIAAPNAQGRYLVHVFEPDSAFVLSLSADRDTVLVGNKVTFHAALKDGGIARALALASGIVTAPDGYSTDLHFSKNIDGSFNATFTPDAVHAIGPQLWEAHAFTATKMGKLSLLRDAKTAFAVSAPTARFNSTTQVSHDTSGLRIRFGVDAASASRYQVSGVLYGHGSDGVLHPAALGQSATWLNAGSGNVELDFDSAALAGSGLTAPFELRDLRLVDQVNMAVIERRERALAIAD